jgi:hypothetical protein
MRSLLVMCALSGVASAGSATSSLRNIDWCNRSYANDSVYPMLSSCKARVDERHSARGGIWAFREFRLVSAAYGDLTGDGDEDALLVLQVTQRPVLLSAAATTSAEFWLLQRRGDDLFIYTSESADAVPTSVTIADGAATLQWRVHGKTCVERWKFQEDGAIKTPRRCKS